jgi:SAM-dependent methyltransferase
MARLAVAVPALAVVHQRIAEYYTAKVKEFGCTPFGVDWTCTATQEMRFVQLLKLCDFSSPFTMNDLGCGYGALAAFLRRRHDACTVDYLGIDLSHEMVRRARRQWRGVERVRFVQGCCNPRNADYSVASGIFNVRRSESDDSWDDFIRATLDQLAVTSGRGFAVNFIDRPRSDGWVTPGLYTTSPQTWIEYCVHHIGADVEVIKEYGMPEFSLLVRRRLGG